MTEKITKRPLSAFMFFMKDFRENNKGNASSIGEAAKVASLKWKSISDTERKVFQDLADKDKKRFEADLAAGMVTSSKKSKKGATKKGTRKQKDPNAPKKAKTAYMCFLVEYRKTSSLTGAKFVSKAAEVWKQTSEKEKEKYVKMGLEDKKRYNDELEKYKKSGGGAASAAGKKSKVAKPTSKNSTKPSNTTNTNDDKNLEDSDDDVSTDLEESGDEISEQSDSE